MLSRVEDYFKLPTDSNSVYPSHSDIHLFHNSVTSLTPIQLVICKNPRSFSSEFFPTQLLLILSLCS